MALNLSSYGQGVALDGALGRVTLTAKTIYIMMLTAAPVSVTAFASLAEYAGTGYARQVWTPGAPAGTPRTSTNSNSISIGPITAGAGGTISHYALVDVSTGTAGNWIGWGAFDTAKTPAVGDTPTIAATATGITIT